MKGKSYKKILKITKLGKLDNDNAKYYTEDEFLKDGGELDKRINKLLDNWDDTPDDVAFERARRNVVKMLESKYMDLEMEIDSCQGAMSGLNEAFQELEIYKMLVRALSGNIDAHKSELVNEWFCRHSETYEKQNKIKPINIKLDASVNSIGDLDKLTQDIANAIFQLEGKLNEVIKDLNAITENLK